MVVYFRIAQSVKPDIFMANICSAINVDYMATLKDIADNNPDI